MRHKGRARLALELLLLALLVLCFGLAQDNGETPTPPPENADTSEPAPDDPETAPPDAAPDEEAPSEDTGDASPGGPAEAATRGRRIPDGADILGSFRLRREGRTIVVNQYAPVAEGGRFVLNARDCDEEAREGRLRTYTVYGGESYLVETLVNDTRITSAIVLQKRLPNEEQADEDTDQARLEMFGGDLAIDEATNCPADIVSSEQQDVRLIQGRTTVDGYRFDYDNDSGVGKMSGPVSLVRVAEGESPALSADAAELEYDEESDLTMLSGDVTIESDGRISKAETVDFDDANSIAILRGSPATSQKGDELFEGNVITYYLDSNDVRVVGNIQGELEVDLGGASSGRAGTPGGNGEPDDVVPEDFVPEDFVPEDDEDLSSDR